MILLLDIGNTRLKWASWDGQALHPGGAEEHRGDPAGVFLGLSLPGTRAVWVSHVLGAQAEDELRPRIQKHFGVAPRFARTEYERDGLTVAYRDPQRLGVDRWLAMVALWAKHRGAFCVVNAGTALTFDAVDATGRHLGGLIGPGLATAQKALLAATRFETASQPARYGAGLGRDTESCVTQGALHACTGMIERATRLGAGLHVITGGDAPALRPHLDSSWDWRPNLVIEGLLELARAPAGVPA